MEQDEIIIDGPLLSRAFRRQTRLWLLLGPLAFGLLLLLALSLTPRSYTAAVSVAMQQPAAPAGIQGLLGGGGGGKHYIGILKSREMADQVERRVNLQQLYGPKTVPTVQAADALLMKGIKPADDPDGLLYISLTLPGPPRLSHGGPAPDQIEQASAQAANAYALALKEYFLTSDTDQGSALLHGADTEVKRARADYDGALERVLGFNRDLGRTDPRNAPTSESPSSSSPSSAPDRADDSTAASGLGGLYSSLFQVQGDLRAALAARQTTAERRNSQINDLSRVPENDPLLADIRVRVKRDQAAVETDSRLLGPENPRIIADQTRLQTDQSELERQVSGVRQNLTTPDAEADAQIQSLYAKQAELVKNIASSQRHLGISRQLSGEQGRLQTEVSLRLDYLRTALGEAAKIRLDNVSAQSRMSIVDTALPPSGGEPTSSKMAVGCLIPVLLAFFVAVLSDYFRSARAKARESRPTPPPTPVNGSGPKPALEPVHEDERLRRPSGSGTL